MAARWFIVSAATGLALLTASFVFLNRKPIPSAGVPAEPTNGPVVGSSAHTPPAESPGAASTNVPESASLEWAAEHENRGTSLLEQGKTDEAVEAYRKALAVNPDDEDLRYNLGIALARQGRIDEAIQQYEEALKLFPEHTDVHNNLGNLLMRQGRWDEAISHFRRALETRPDSAIAHNNLGIALSQQGRVGEATRHFMDAITYAPDYWEAHFGLGNAYLALGRPDEAITEYTTVLRLNPGCAPAQRKLDAARKTR